MNTTKISKKKLHHKIITSPTKITIEGGAIVLTFFYKAGDVIALPKQTSKEERSAFKNYDEYKRELYVVKGGAVVPVEMPNYSTMCCYHCKIPMPIFAGEELTGARIPHNDNCPYLKGDR